MKNNSIWKETKQDRTCPKLTKDLTTDVLIIGGGITGISTAYHLINSNLKICLVERNTIGNGVTSKTTGKLTYLQESIYSKLKTYHGLEKTKLYLESQIEAINMVKNIVEANKIECNLEKSKSYVFAQNDSKKIDNETRILRQFNIQ